MGVGTEGEGREEGPGCPDCCHTGSKGMAGEKQKVKEHKVKVIYSLATDHC